MTKKQLTDQEKMDAWYNGTRNQNVKGCSDDKLINYFKICNESGYFLQSVKLRKEIHERDLYYYYNDNEAIIDILEMDLSKVPDSYFQNHTKDQITKDLLDYINNFETYIGDSIDESGFVINDGGIVYYSWDGSDKDECPLVVDTNKTEVMLRFSDTIIEYTEPDNLHKTLNLIYDEFFSC